MDAQRRTGFTLVEILIATALITIMAGVGVVSLTGVRERAREARLLNDVAVVNNGIDAYLAAGGVIPPESTPEEVLAKLKTVASPDSTAMGPPGPFIDQRLQLVMQTPEQAATDEARADYPNSAGYFYVRKDGDMAIRTFVNGEASPVVTEVRQGAMPYTAEGEFIAGYTDRAASSPAAAAAPAAVGRADESAKTGRDLVKFPRPRIRVRTAGTTNTFFDYGGESLPLLYYPLEVEVSSPARVSSAQLQYSLSGGSFVDVQNPATIAEIDPGPTLIARVVSRDTTRFTNSDPLSIRFLAQPVQVIPVFPASDSFPSTMTYAQAGGAMVGLTKTDRLPVTIRLENIGQVPMAYRYCIEAFLTKTTKARYTGVSTTVTNTNFAAPNFTPVSIPIDVAGFGASTSIALYANVETSCPEFVVVADPLDRSTAIQTTALVVNVLPLQPIGLPPTVTITHSGSVPVGMRKFYTSTLGSTSAAPLNPLEGGTNIPSAITYVLPIANTNSSTYTVSAQATGPAGTEHWFTSSLVSRTYIAITTVPLKYIGLNMFEANINGFVRGSIYMQAGDFAILNAGATIAGNVYVPGLPAVVLPAGVETGTGSKKVALRNQAYNQSEDATIETNRITGREYNTDGVLADPQLDLRKIVDLYGSSQPSNYDVTVNNSARIDGKLYRRANPPPVSGTKPGLPSDIPLNNTPVTITGTNTLASGSYAVTLNNSNSVLRLGVAGNLTKYVFGPGSTWTAGRVEILGPVQIFLNAATSFNGVIFGSSNSIPQTGFVVMSNYSVSIDNNSAVYGQFEARDSAISVGSGGGQTVRGSFYGSAFAKRVNVDGSGYVDVSSGSDTNSVTPSPTPTPRATPTPTP